MEPGKGTVGSEDLEEEEFFADANSPARTAMHCQHRKVISFRATFDERIGIFVNRNLPVYDLLGKN